MSRAPSNMAAMDARPTIYRGVRMRSRLEAGFASWLDSVGIPWEHEPAAFGAQRGQYLPDFRLRPEFYDPPGGEIVMYAEVKPPGLGGADVASVLRRMEIVWASEPGAALMLATSDDIGYWSFPLGLNGRWQWAEWWSTLWSNARLGEAERVGLGIVDELEWPPRYTDKRPSPMQELVVSPWTRRYWGFDIR